MAFENYGPGVTAVVDNAGAPGAGTNETQTMTIDATGGTFKLSYEGATTAALAWNAVNVTLLATINTALNGLATLGTSWVVATAGTLTAGVGTITLTFSGGDVAHKAVSLITIANNSLTGTGTLTNVEGTPGVTATRRDAVPGSQVLDVTNKKLYIHTGTQGVPTWTLVASNT